MSFAAPIFALLLLLGQDPPADTGAAGEPQILIERRDPTAERVLFDPKNPPRDMPKLHPGEAALCQFNFNCAVNLKYEVVEHGGATKARDADGRGGAGAGAGTNVSAHIRQVKVTLTLHDKIYIPRGAGPKIRAHEEGHRIINERVYEDAERVAREAAMEVLTQTWRGSGESSDAAGKAATDEAVRTLCDAYLAGTAGRASRIGDIYDELTRHGQNTRLAEADAIRQAFARYQAEHHDKAAPAAPAEAK